MLKAVRKIIWILSALVFLFSSTMVIKHYLQLQSSVKLSETITQMAVIPTENDLSPELNTVTTSEPLPIQVDFELLRKQNPDVFAWLYCPDTPINYPVVQASDNEYYLRRLLDGSYNFAGTLFMDYRNAVELSDWNSIIYGHNLKNDLMFGTLPKYKDKAYFDETVAKIVETRDWTIEELKNLGFECLDSAANFIFAKHPEYDAKELFTALKENDIYVRFWGSKRIEQYMRISVGTREEMEALLAFLKKHMNK